MSTVTYCDTCHRMKGISCGCDLPYADKLRTIQLHPSVTESRTKRRYWDQEALDDQFGPDAKEKSEELTKGKGWNQETLTDLFDD